MILMPLSCTEIIKGPTLFLPKVDILLEAIWSFQVYAAINLSHHFSSFRELAPNYLRKFDQNHI